MPCLLALIGFFFPRLVLVGMLLLSDYLGRAYQGWFLPLLGFFFMPFTTLAYAVAMNEGNQSVRGGWLVLVVFAVLIDLGALGGQGRSARRRSRQRQIRS